MDYFYMDLKIHALAKNPKVSVIIPTYNRANYITQAIDSVLNQTYKDYEIIVVDDGSTDNTEEVLKPYIDKIKYFYKENGGCASARNYGIKKSMGEYLAFLDSDALFEPLKLEKQVLILDRDPDIGFVFSDGLLFEENSNKKARLVQTENKYLGKKEFIKTFFKKPDIFMPSTLIRHKSFGEAGLFDEELKYHEDGDMLLRIGITWKSQYSDYPSVKVRHHKGRKSKNRQDIYYGIKKSWIKILFENPELDKDIIASAVETLREIQNRLASEYLMGEMFREARREFLSQLIYFRSLNLKIIFYILIISFGNTISKFMFFRVLPLLRKITI